MIVTSGNAPGTPGAEEFEILYARSLSFEISLQEESGRKMILWNGACIVHEIFSVGDLLALKKKLPHGLTIAHPECPANIREHSDFVGGTEAMLKYIGNATGPTDFLVATEANMMWQMQNKFPQHRYHPVPGITCACNKCPHMARNTLEKLRDCLATGGPEITWQPEFERKGKGGGAEACRRHG